MKKLITIITIMLSLNTFAENILHECDERVLDQMNYMYVQKA